jgi:hypothetical protein
MAHLLLGVECVLRGPLEKLGQSLGQDAEALQQETTEETLTAMIGVTSVVSVAIMLMIVVHVEVAAGVEADLGPGPAAVTATGGNPIPVTGPGPGQDPDVMIPDLSQEISFNNKK